MISTEYLALNKELHARNPHYGTSGDRWAPAVRDLIKRADGKIVTLLDYGCGKGTLKVALSKVALARDYGDRYNIREYDPAIPGKDMPPSPADLVVCGDVLEHIEPDCLDAVLNDMRELTKYRSFLVASTVEAKKTLADGRNAHLIVEPIEWWLKKLLARWHPIAFERQDRHFIFIGEA